VRLSGLGTGVVLEPAHQDVSWPALLLGRLHVDPYPWKDPYRR